MPSHAEEDKRRKDLATDVKTARKKNLGHSRVTVTERQGALIKAKRLDQEFSPGARGNKNRFREMIMKSSNPKAAIEQIEKFIEKKRR